MASRPRSRKKRGWPDGLYERGGYFSWRNPLTGVEMGIGRVPEADAKAQASEANIEIAGLRNKPRLVDRLTGKADRSFRACLQRYEKKLGLVPLELGAEQPDRVLAANTRKTYRSAVRLVRETFAESLDLPIDKVTTLIIAAGIRKVRKTMSRSAQAMRSRLADIFDSAIAEGWTSSNPVTVTDDVPVTVKRARLTWEVFKAAYDREKLPSTRNTMALALVSAQPREVLASALFTDCGPLDRPGMPAVECWMFERGKTKVKIAIPLDLRLDVFGMSLREVIAQCRSTKVVSRYMIHSSTPRRGAKLGDPVHYNRMTRDVSASIEALGIDWGEQAPPTLHEIRSLSKRLYKQQGGVDTKDLLGHKTEQMSDLYADARGAEYKLVAVR